MCKIIRQERLMANLLCQMMFVPIFKNSKKNHSVAENMNSNTTKILRLQTPRH